MQWCFLRASLMTLAVFATVCESRANDVAPTDVTSANDVTGAIPDSATGDLNEPGEKNADEADDSHGPSASGLSSGGLCATVASAAEENGLPISFFSNLIWQESRFVLSARSPVGAQGIAQFMPKTAALVGLDDPFDPNKALPASARLLHDLSSRYGNLGLAAAAYNAGEGLVNRWLQRGGSLPRETRNYVLTITGVPVERWKGTTDGPQAFPLAKRMPCRDHEAFAGETTVADSPAVVPNEEATPRKLARHASRSMRKLAAHHGLHQGKHRRLARLAESRSRRRG